MNLGIIYEKIESQARRAENNFFERSNKSTVAYFAKQNCEGKT